MLCVPNAFPYTLTMALAVTCVDVKDAGCAVGTDTPVANISDETRINPKVTDAATSACLEDTSRQAITESEAQVDAAQAVPILTRGLKSTT
jgi:hypothetical protein